MCGSILPPALGVRDHLGLFPASEIPAGLKTPRKGLHFRFLPETATTGQYSGPGTSFRGLGGGLFSPRLSVIFRCQISVSFTWPAPPAGPQIVAGEGSWDLAPGDPILEHLFCTPRHGQAGNTPKSLSAGTVEYIQLLFRHRAGSPIGTPGFHGISRFETLRDP